jgi:DNA-binding HxlR family transcriptional regulator
MKSLRQRLQQFESLGLIERHQYEQRQLKVEYTLTDKGRRFNELLQLAKQIADEWKTTSCECPLTSTCALNKFSCSKRRELRAKLVGR